MLQPVPVLVLGTGQMGCGIVRLLLEKQGLELVGVYGRRAERAGRDVGTAIGLGRELGLSIRGDLAELVEGVRPQVAIQATCSRLAEGAGEIETLLERGVNVISIAEEMAYPRARSPELAKRLDELAVAHGVTLLGTGVNPGFVLDLLVIALSGVCARVDAITAPRVNDLSPYGPSVLASQGVGLTPEAFHRQVENGTVVGHLGFPESIGMIAAALGWRIDRIEQSLEPIVSRVRRATPFVTVEPGLVAGCRQTAVAHRDGRPVIELIHPQQIHPHLEEIVTGDCIEIAGEPPLRLSGSPEIPGGIATVALAINMIPRVLNAPPGLATMADLPVPAAIMGDARSVLARESRWHDDD
jgi:4-hydroxy-tetrahydrodipicolinate reductase